MNLVVGAARKVPGVKREQMGALSAAMVAHQLERTARSLQERGEWLNAHARKPRAVRPVELAERIAPQAESREGRGAKSIDPVAAHGIKVEGPRAPLANGHGFCPVEGKAPMRRP